MIRAFRNYGYSYLQKAGKAISMLVGKTTAILTVVCFVLTAVCGQTLAALAQDNQVTAYYEKPVEDFALPNTIGRITGACDKGSDTVVVAIQDLHCHPEVQRNIADILSFLKNEYKADTVYLEGTWGKTIDTGWLRSITDEGMRQSVIDGLVRHGELTGVEKFAAQTSGVEVRGLENEKFYKENSLRLKAITEEREPVDQMVGGIDKAVTGIRHSYFNARQNKIEELVSRHQSGKLESGKYYAMLLKYGPGIGMDNESYPDLRGYVNLLSLEKQISYKKVSRELGKLIAELRRTLPYATYQELAKNTGDFQKIDQFYMQFNALRKTCPVALDRYPSLTRFFQYLDTGKQVNPLGLIKEERRLVNELGFAMAENKSQQEVVFLTAFTRVLKDFYANKITAEDYTYFTSHYPEFEMLYQVYAGKDTIKRLAPYYTLYHDYYQANVARNEYFVTNITEGNTCGKLAPLAGKEEDRVCAALHHAKRVVVVVTGGFHTEGLTGLLAQKGITTLTITPNVTEDTKTADLVYTRILAHQNRVLSQAFAAIALSLLGEGQQLSKIAGIALCKYFKALESGRISSTQVNDELNGKILKNPLAYFSQLPEFVKKLNLDEKAIASSKVTALELEPTKDANGNYLFSITVNGDKKRYVCSPDGVVTPIDEAASKRGGKNSKSKFNVFSGLLVLFLALIFPGNGTTADGNTSGLVIITPKKEVPSAHPSQTQLHRWVKSPKLPSIEEMAAEKGYITRYVAKESVEYLGKLIELREEIKNKTVLKLREESVLFTRIYKEGTDCSVSQPYYPLLKDAIKNLLKEKKYNEVARILESAVCHINALPDGMDGFIYRNPEECFSSMALVSGKVKCLDPLALQEGPVNFQNKIGQYEGLRKALEEITGKDIARDLWSLTYLFQSGDVTAAHTQLLEALGGIKVDEEDLNNKVLTIQESNRKKLSIRANDYGIPIIESMTDIDMAMLLNRFVIDYELPALLKVDPEKMDEKTKELYNKWEKNEEINTRLKEIVLELGSTKNKEAIEKRPTQKQRITSKQEKLEKEEISLKKQLSPLTQSEKIRLNTAILHQVFGEGLRLFNRDAKREIILYALNAKDVKSKPPPTKKVKDSAKSVKEVPAKPAIEKKNHSSDPEEPRYTATISTGKSKEKDRVVFQANDDNGRKLLSEIMNKRTLRNLKVPDADGIEKYMGGKLIVDDYPSVIEHIDSLIKENRNIEVAIVIGKISGHLESLFKKAKTGYYDPDAAFKSIKYVKLKDRETVLRWGNPFCLELNISEEKFKNGKNNMLEQLIAHINSRTDNEHAQHIVGLIGIAPREREIAEDKWENKQKEKERKLNEQKEADEKIKRDNHERALQVVRGPWEQRLAIGIRKSEFLEFGFHVAEKWKATVAQAYELVVQKKANKAFEQQIMHFRYIEQGGEIYVIPSVYKTFGEQMEAFRKAGNMVEARLLMTQVKTHLERLEKFDVGYTAGPDDILCAIGVVGNGVACCDFPYLKEGISKEKALASIRTALERIEYSSEQIDLVMGTKNKKVKNLNKSITPGKNGLIKSFISILPYGLLLLVISNLLQYMHFAPVTTGVVLTALGMVLKTNISAEKAALPSSPLANTPLFKKTSILVASTMDKNNENILLEEAKLGMCPIGITMAQRFETVEDVNRYLGSKHIPVGSVQADNTVFTVCAKTIKNEQGNEAVILSLGLFLVDHEGNITLSEDQGSAASDGPLLVEASQEIIAHLKEKGSKLAEEILRTVETFNVDSLYPVIFTLNISAGLNGAVLRPDIVNTMAVVYSPIDVNITRIRNSTTFMAAADSIIVTSQKGKQNILLSAIGLDPESIKVYPFNCFLRSTETHLLSLVPVLLHKKAADEVTGVRPGTTFSEEADSSHKVIDETMRRAGSFNADVQLMGTNWIVYASLIRKMLKENIPVRVFANIVVKDGQHINLKLIRRLAKMGFHFRIDLSQTGANVNVKEILDIKAAAPGKAVKIVPSEQNAEQVRKLCVQSGYLYVDRRTMGDDITWTTNDVKVSVEIQPPVDAAAKTFKDEADMAKQLEKYFAAPVSDICLPASVLHGSFSGQGFSRDVVDKVIRALINIRFAVVPERSAQKAFVIGKKLMTGMTAVNRRQYLEKLRFGMPYAPENVMVPGFHVLLRAYDLLWKQGTENRQEFEKWACKEGDNYKKAGNFFYQFDEICENAGLINVPEWQPLLRYVETLKRDAAISNDREAKILANRKLMECVRGVMLTLLKEEHPCGIPFEQESDMELWYELLLQSDAFLINEPNMRGATIQAHDPRFCEISFTRVTALPGILLSPGRLDEARNILVNIIGNNHIYEKIKTTDPSWQLLYVEYLYSYSQKKEKGSENLISTEKYIKEAVRMIFDTYDSKTLKGKPGLIGMYYNTARILEELDSDNAEKYRSKAKELRGLANDWVDKNNSIPELVGKNVNSEPFECSPLMLIALSHTQDLLDQKHFKKVLAMVKPYETDYGIRLPNNKIVPGLMGYYLEALRIEGKLSSVEIDNKARNFAYRVLESGGMSARLNADFSNKGNVSPEAVAEALRILETITDRKSALEVINEGLHYSIETTRAIMSAA